MENAMTYDNKTLGKSHYIDFPLARLHVVEVGTGSDTILLWPSIFTDHFIYEGLVTHLGDKFRFLLVDGFGHGLSEAPDKEFQMRDCALAMAAVLDHFRLKQAIIGGTSWGGMAGAELALLNPRCIKALILMNTPMEIGKRAPSISTKMIAIGSRWMLNWAMYRNGVANSFFTDSVLVENKKYSDAFHNMLFLAKPRKLSTAIRSVLLQGKPLKPRMKDISTPTLIIAGKDDQMYPIEQQAEAALLAPNSHFMPIEGKHISVIEQPKKVAQIIEDFLIQEVLL